MSIKVFRFLKNIALKLINFGWFSFTSFIIAFIVIIAFRMSEKYTVHIALVTGLFTTIYFLKLFFKFKSNKTTNNSSIVKKSILFLVLMEIVIVLMSPLHSLFLDELLVKTKILKNIDEVKDCQFAIELEKAESFMQNEIDLSKVKIFYGGDADLASNLPKPFPQIKATTWGNFIYVSKKAPCVSDHLLVHELTHVWQYQKGFGFGPKWILLWPYYYLQYFTKFDSLYDFGGYQGLMKAQSENKKFTDFGLEQQADIVGTYYYVITRYRSPDLYKSSEFNAIKFFISQEFSF